ncbi:hypothetical protein [Sphingomonas arantia]
MNTASAAAASSGNSGSNGISDRRWTIRSCQSVQAVDQATIS